MYRITIYNDGIPLVVHGERCKVANASTTEAKNEIGTLTFDIHPNNPGYGFCRPLSTTVEVTDTRNGSVTFEGRVIMPVPSMAESGLVLRTVTCKHVADYLRDSTQPYAEERQWESPLAFCEHVLAVHNAAMPEHKRVYPGVIDMQTYETSDGLFCGIQRGSTWNALQEKLVKAFGGEMRVRRGTDGLLYLDYRERLGVTRATRITLGRNMKSARREVNPNAVITRLYPYGCKLTATETDESGNEVEVETEERLTIESVNDGVPYIDDAVAIEEYGVIEGVREWDDVTVAANLLSKAKSWLGQNNGMPVSTTVTALDLEKLGLDADGFELHDWYPCQNPLIGLDSELEVVRISKGVSDPSQVSFDLGVTVEHASKKLASIGSLSSEVKRFESQSNTAVRNVRNSVRATAAAILVGDDSIRQEVSESVSTVSAEVADAKGYMNDALEIIAENSTKITEMLQTAEGWEFTFEELETTVRQFNEQYYTTYEQRIKFILFDDGKIYIGENPGLDGSAFQLVLANDRISFLQNNVEVAYMSNNTLYITTAHITYSLRIGSYEAKPRANGNLSWRYVGGDA